MEIKVNQIPFEPFSKQKIRYVNIMVYQFHSFFTEDGTSDWRFDETHGLYFPKNLEKFRTAIFKALNFAADKKVNLIVFPELSVPKELIEEIRYWSIGKDLVIVAGSHYTKLNSFPKHISVSPVIYSGKIQGYSQKIQLASINENIPLKEEGLCPGNEINVFENSPIGNFAILICSDNLDEEEIVKSELKKFNLDFWIIPAFQKGSIHHYKRMTVDYENNEGRYLIYCNNNNEFADGGSSFFGELDNIIIDRYKRKGYTNNEPDGKVISLDKKYDYFILKVDTTIKKIPKKQTVNYEANIKFVDWGLLLNSSINTNENHVVEKQTENGNTDEPTIIVKGNFVIQPTPKYEEALSNIELKKEHLKSEIKNNGLVNSIIQCLDEKGIAIITAPIRFGKTYILKHIQNKLSGKMLVYEVNSKLFTGKKDAIDSINKLYYVWFKEIVDIILQKINRKSSDLGLLYYERITIEDRFISWIENEKPRGESNIQGFIRCLCELKKELKFEQEIIVSFHLDEIQKHISQDMFKHLEEDISKWPKEYYPNGNHSVKLLAASRYLTLLSLRKPIVFTLPYFETDQIISLIKNVIDEMDELAIQQVSSLVHSYTSGYPWFVIRFLKIYISKRIGGDKKHPSLLTISIFNEKICWLMDVSKESKVESDFMFELSELIDKSTTVMKSNLKEFLQRNNTALELDNGYSYINDFLVRQTGFMQFDETGEIFSNQGNYVMNTHFKPEIQRLL